jgi:hypothetical protein
MHVEAPVVKTALTELALAYPQSLAFPDLVERVSARVKNLAHPEASLAAGLAEFVGLGVLSTRVRPFVLRTEAGDRPRLSAVSRYQVEKFGNATNRHHIVVNLPPGFERAALARADGRPREALATELAGLVEAGQLGKAEFPAQAGPSLRQAVDQRLAKTLSEAARLALLVPEG